MKGKLTINVMKATLKQNKTEAKTHWERFGEWLRKKRREADLTQAEVAKRAKIHEVQVARIEKGESGTKRETAISLANAIGLDVFEVVDKAGYSLADPDKPEFKSIAERKREFGAWLNDARISAGLSLEEVAARVGESVENLSRLENGYGAILRNKSKVFAKALHINEIDFLKRYTPEMAINEPQPISTEELNDRLARISFLYENLSNTEKLKVDAMTSLVEGFYLKNQKFTETEPELETEVSDEVEMTENKIKIPVLDSANNAKE